MGNVIKWLFVSNAGRAVLVGAIFLGAMSIARWYYVDRPRQLDSEARGAGAALLESMAERLDDAHSEAKDSEAFVESLPTLSEWYPRHIPCGTAVPFPAERQPIWDILSAPTEGKTEFQYRFDRNHDTFILRARRDSDCDNLYATHTLSGSTDWASMSSTQLESQNSDE